MKRRTLTIAMAAAALSTAVLAQSYPAKPITMVVPVPPGGAVDATARAVAQELGKRLGQTVIVENKAGAAGIVGTQGVARAAPDGYTLLLTHGSPILNAPYMMDKVPYDPKTDFAFITQVGTSDLVVLVGKDVPARNMKEFVSWAKQNRGKLSYGSFGIGGVGHLMSAYLNQSQQLDMTHVPSKGEAPLVQDLLAGVVPWGMTSLAPALPHIESGRLRALAIVGQQRFRQLPNVPTMAEAGFPDAEFKAVGWLGLLAPAATPPDILRRLENEARAAIQATSVSARLHVFGFRPVAGTSAEFKRSFEEAAPIIERLVKTSGAKTQ